MENRSKSANNEENNWSRHFYIKLSIWVLGEADTKMEFEVKDKGNRESRGRQRKSSDWDVGWHLWKLREGRNEDEGWRSSNR